MIQHFWCIESWSISWACTSMWPVKYARGQHIENAQWKHTNCRITMSWVAIVEIPNNQAHFPVLVENMFEDQSIGSCKSQPVVACCIAHRIRISLICRVWPPPYACSGSSKSTWGSDWLNSGVHCNGYFCAQLSLQGLRANFNHRVLIHATVIPHMMGFQDIIIGCLLRSNCSSIRNCLSDHYDTLNRMFPKNEARKYLGQLLADKLPMNKIHQYRDPNLLMEMH